MSKGQKPMTKVMCFGSFDGLHKGHLSYFRQARVYGDTLIAVVALDDNVKKFKGRLPKHTQEERLAEVRHCDLVDIATLGGHDIFDVIREYAPHVACLGYDQKADTKQLQILFPNLNIVRLKAHQPEVYKSSLLNNS